MITTKVLKFGKDPDYIQDSNNNNNNNKIASALYKCSLVLYRPVCVLLVSFQCLYQNKKCIYM